MPKTISKEALRFMYGNWNRLTTEEIAAELKVSTGTITGWAAGLRKRGINLPKRSRSDASLDAVAEEIKLAGDALGEGPYEGQPAN